MSPRPHELRERLTAAISEVTLAEDVLEKALRELTRGPRPEKVAVTAVVTDAFTRLRRAHEALNEVRDLIDSD